MATSLGSMEWSAASEPIRAGEPSGDAWLVRPRGEGVLIAVLDALGHGAPAAEVAQLTIATLGSDLDAPLPDLLQRCHTQLRERRGVAMGLLAYQPSESRIEWLAVGNIQAVLARIGGDGRVTTQSLLHRRGVLGRTLPPGAPQALTVQDRDVLVVATDGLRPTFAEDVTPLAPPESLAQRLLLRHRRLDDALALVVRFHGGDA
jgi:negative regulator of sigma-B (phosphoserine phosphatase)